MGKASKSRRSSERKKAKRAAKEAKRSLYERYAKEGRTQKGNSARTQPSNRKHPTRPCGNFGCNRCYPKKSMSVAA